MIIVVMGVAGAGKTSVGTRLAAALGCGYLEGDALHSAASIEKMARGIPLDDSDRAPWLAAIRERMEAADALGDDLVVGCSALKASYRRYLAEGLEVIWVHLTGPARVIAQRLRERQGHFMPAELLGDQLEILDPPEDAITVDVSQPLEDVVAEVLRRLPKR